MPAPARAAFSPRSIVAALRTCWDTPVLSERRASHVPPRALWSADCPRPGGEVMPPAKPAVRSRDSRERPADKQALPLPTSQHMGSLEKGKGETRHRVGCSRATAGLLFLSALFLTQSHTVAAALANAVLRLCSSPATRTCSGTAGFTAVAENPCPPWVSLLWDLPQLIDSMSAT